MENNKLVMFHCLPYISENILYDYCAKARADLLESAQHNRDREKSHSSRKPQRFVKG